MKILNSNNTSPVTENSSIEIIIKKRVRIKNKKERSKNLEQKSEKFFAKNGDTF